MVAVRPGAPSPAEPRVACPVCGGQIHPIAGRCKHCKTDLSTMRGGAQSGPTALPALGAYVPPVPIVAPPSAAQAAATVHASSGYAPIGYANGHGSHAALAPMPSALQPPAIAMASASSTRIASAWSRRWPIVVVVLAAIAIVVSIVLLMRGEDPPSSKVHRATQPSMDNNMNTNPMLPNDPSGAIKPDDPWGGPPSVDPAVPPPSPPVPLNGSGPPPKNEFWKSVYQTTCDRVKACGAADGVASLCDDSTITSLATYATCGTYDTSKAASCIRHLADFPCTIGTNGDLDPSQFMDLIQGFSDCREACS
jgi:hypothetical protein